MSTEEILRLVAAGELTPEEAMPLLEAARPDARTTAPADAEVPYWGTPPGPDLRDLPGEPTVVREGDAPRQVRIAVSYRSLRVLADPGVDGAFVSGEHTVRRDGDALVVASPSPTSPRRSPAPAPSRART